MANIEPTSPLTPHKPSEPGKGGTIPAGGTFGSSIDSIKDIVNGLKKWLIFYLAQIKMMEALEKKEQAFASAAEDYHENPTKANAKALFEALKDLKAFITGGYKQYAQGLTGSLGAKARAALDAEIKSIIFGEGPDGKSTGGPSIIKVLEHLFSKDPAKWKGEVQDWFNGKLSDSDFEKDFLGVLNNFDSKTKATSKEAQGYNEMQQNFNALIQAGISMNKVVQGQMGLIKSDIQALEQGASKIAAKAFQTLQTMIKLTAGV